MKLPAICLLLAATVLACASLWPRSSPHLARGLEASAPVHITGPTVVNVHDLPAPSPRLAGGTEQSPPRIPSPRLGPDGPAPAANVIDTSAGVASAPTTTVGFEGLSNSDNMNTVHLDLSQPDSQLAVGPGSIVELINVLGSVVDKNGGVLRTFTLKDFFGLTPADFVFNSRIIYDAPSGRWFATTASFINHSGTPDEGAMHLAVSQSSDPLGAWSIYHTDFVDIFPDQPSIGLTDDKVTVSSAMYRVSAVASGAPSGADAICLTYCGEQTIVFQKSDLIDGVPADELGRYAFPNRLGRFAVRPAHSLTPTKDQYLGMFSTTSRSRLDIIRITGTPDEGNVTEAELTELTIITQNDPPPSITAGSADCIVFGHNSGPPPCIDSDDYRLLEVVWRDNKMWLAASAACRPLDDDTTRSCAHLIEVETEGTPSKTQDIMYGAAGEYYSWPAIRTTDAGDLIVALTHTNPSIFAEMRVAGRKGDDNPNTMGGSTLIRPGEVVHTSGRWGDYLGAAVDPEHPNCVWIAGEFAKVTLGRDWSTYLASTSYRDDCPAASAPTATPMATPTNTPTPTPTSTSTPSSTPTPLPRYGDVNNDTQVNSIDASLLLQFRAGIICTLPPSQTSPCPTPDSKHTQKADVNQDGAVNAIDAALILQFTAGLLSSLPTS